MPLLIRTPDDIFRQEPGKDLYFVEFYAIDSQSGKARPFEGRNPPGRQELMDWLAQTLPHVKVESLAPPEASGFIAGGVNGRIRIDFDTHTLKSFCDHWEDSSGKSKDPRWQCMQMSYHSWLDRYYPLSAELLRSRQSLAIANGEKLNLFFLTPVTPEFTMLPCTLGLYWNRDDSSLRPGIILYRDDVIEHHAWLALDGADTCLAVGCDLTPDEIIQCRNFVASRHVWLMEWFEAFSDIHDFSLPQKQIIESFISGECHGFY